MGGLVREHRARPELGYAILGLHSATFAERQLGRPLILPFRCESFRRLYTEATRRAWRGEPKFGFGGGNVWQRLRLEP